MFPGRREIIGFLLDGHWGVVTRGRGNGSARGVGRWVVKGFEEDGLSQLLAATPKGSGRTAALTLPLSLFDVVQLQFPPVPPEAMNAAVTYQLQRQLGGEISNYVFDWTEVGRDARAVDVLAFTMEKGRYQGLEGCFSRSGYRLAYLEPDVSSAMALLELLDGELAPPQANLLLLLLWEESLTLGIKEGDRIAVARSVAMGRVEAVELELEPKVQEEGQTDILEAFGLVQGGSEEAAKEQEADPLAIQKRRYREYLDDVVLEVVRTRDYFSSVIKHGRIDAVVVGGPEHVAKDLTVLLHRSLEVPVAPIPGDLLDLPCDSAQAAVAVGAVTGR